MAAWLDAIMKLLPFVLEFVKLLKSSPNPAQVVAEYHADVKTDRAALSNPRV